MKMNEMKERIKRKSEKRKGRQAARFLLTMSIMLLPQAAFADKELLRHIAFT